MKRLLIAGCGDIARRVLPALGSRFEVRVLSRSNGMDLDRPESLAALEPADAVLHCVPPPQTGAAGTRTANLLAVLEGKRILPTRFVYISTSGVYGDCGGGALVDESRAVNPQSERKGESMPRNGLHYGATCAVSRWCSCGRRASTRRIARSEAALRMPLGLLSFMNESRRLDNARLKRILGVRLRYPTVSEGLGHEHTAGIDEPA